MLGDHPGKVARLALVFIAVGLLAPFDVHLAAFVDVLLADLAQPDPGIYIESIGGFFGLAVAASPTAVDSDGELADFASCGGEAGSRVFA